MGSEKNGALVATLLVGFFQCLLAQNCDFTSCPWTIRKGFVRTNYSQIQDEVGVISELENKNGTNKLFLETTNSEDYAYRIDPDQPKHVVLANPDRHLYHNDTCVDDFGYCSNTTEPTCRIRGPWLIPDANSQTVCVFLDVYAGLKQIYKSSLRTVDAIVKGLLNISVTTVDGVHENRLQNISHLHHNRWDTLSTRFNYLDEKFRIVIEVTLGDGAGFLAIDNIALVINCANTANFSEVNKTHRCIGENNIKCDDHHCIRRDQVCNLHRDCANGRDETESFCSQLPLGMQCNFENADWCGWDRYKFKAPLNWTLHNGPTPTGGTGPSVDHTYGNSSGYYMYLESGQGSFMEEAVLLSRVFNNVHVFNGCKLRFFYHLFGRRIGRLEVQITNWCRSSTPLTLWRQSEEQGDKWVYQEVPLIRGFRRFTIQFTASKGLMDHGDIAIDDVSFSPQCFGYNITETSLIRMSPIEEPLPLRTFWKDRKKLCQDGTQAKETTRTSLDIDTTENDTENVTWSTTAPHAIHSPDINSPENISSSTIPIEMMKVTKLPIAYIVIIVVAGVIVSCVMGSTILCIALRRKKGGSVPSGRLEIMSDSPDHRPSPPVQTSSFDMQLRCTVTELNPNYDFINAKYPEHQLREIPRNKLKLTRLIGQGAFGEVYEGTLKNLCANVDQLQVAVKTLPALCNEQAETDFEMEAVIISKFMHKNVVKCLGVCFEDHPRYIVLELLQGGDLRSFLRDSRPKDGDSVCVITMEDLVKLALDIANGCRHLEEKRFIHRDIAARNCLLTSRTPDRIAKIADFGMSRDIYSADYYRKGGKTLLPIKWMPPEAFLDGVFTTKTDVWSFGILLWEIFTLGYMPYPGQTNTDVMHFIASGGRLDPPDNCPARLNKIMIMCWNSVADIRPSFSEIIEHLDMCLQDPDVMNADLSECHFHIGEYFKDAATLARSDALSSPEDTMPSPTVDIADITAEFRGHVESQSTEPLLQI